MLYRLSFALLFLTAAHTTQAQCNPKEYTRIFQEATTLQEKGQFIEAKNRYEAAKIYACNQKEKDAADGRVDALFEQIDQLRARADSSAEAARLALEKQQAALADVVRLTLRDASERIYHLDYEGALEKMKSAARLQAALKEVSDALLEMVFFYAETGRFERAKGVLDTVILLSGRDLTAFKKLSNLEDFRAALKTLNPARLDSLDARYFPTMLPIPGGTDTLGGDSGDEKPRHAVTLSPFKMAKTETTWWQYNLFCEATNKRKPHKPVGWGGEGDNPVTSVSWYDAVKYANWLSERNGVTKAISKTGNEYAVNLRNSGYRLPTEAEWEYAARAGTNSKYAGSNDIDAVAWHGGNSGSHSHPVAGKKANAYGLHDLSGNVWEWCWDWYGEKYYEKLRTSPEKDPLGPISGDYRLLRGGSWTNETFGGRVAVRHWINPDDGNIYYGFRLVRHL